MINYLYDNVYFVFIILSIILSISSIYSGIYTPKILVSNIEDKFRNDILKILEIIKKEKGDIKKELDILSDLADLKMKKYDIKIDKDNICVICLEHLKSDITKKNCNHFFHISCLKNWHKINRNCPVCRK